MSSCVRAISLFIAVCAAVLAQSSGTLTGVITDPSQANLPGVSLSLTNESTGVAERAVSNPQGEYTFPLLQPGRYRLSVEAKGFRPYTQSGIVLESARVSRLDVKMELGQVTEAVEVTGAAPLLESESSTVGQFIEHKTVMDMPLTGRRVGELLALQGNSIFIQGDVIRPRVAVAGGRSDQQQWLIDGVNGSNMALEVPQALFNPPVESVQEIRIQQNSYSAEYGNTSSGVVAITTRSGTNQFHGNAYEFFRNDKLDASNFFAARKPPLRWNIFGFSVGGPIRRNRTFFFSNVEWQKQRIGATQTLTLPTDVERAGDFSRTLTAAGALVPIYDPDTTAPDPARPGQMIRTQFPGNVIPRNRLDPVGAALAALYPLPNRTPTNRAGANNFSGNNVTALNLTTWTAKVDHQIRSNDRVSVRFILHNFPTSTSAVFPEVAADPTAAYNSRRAYSTLVEEIHNFSGAVVNDFRYNFQPRYFYNLSYGLDQGWPQKLGLKGVSDRAFPRVAPAGYSAMGPGTQERIQTPIRDTDIIDTVSWFHGSHSFRFGGEFRLVRNVDILNNQVSGMLAFATQPTAQPNVANTGNAIASLLVGFPNSGTVHATDLLDRRAKYVAVFAQDDWKLTHNLTVNIGLRWEVHTPRTDANNRQSGFNTTAINPVSKTPGVVTFAGLNGLGTQIYDGDYNNFEPRIGLAWKVGTRTVIRAGAGIFFGPPQPGSNNTSAGFETSGSFSTPDNGITPPFLLRNGFPGGAARAQLGPEFGAVPVGSAVVFAPTFIESPRALGYTEQWNFGIQRELGWDAVLELSYLGNGGHRLNGPDTSINQVPISLMGSGNAQIRRPFPQFGNVSLVAPMWGNSSYHALNIKAEKRFSHGLNFTANYTFSKFIDDVAPSFQVGSEPGNLQNFYDRRSEKSLSANDVRNRFVVSSVYELPVGKNKRWALSGVPAAVLGGWSFGLIGILQQGGPDGLTVQTNGTNSFNPGPLRPNVLRDPSLGPGERSISRWFDTTAVAAPAPFTFGNAGRALLTGPGLIDVSLSLLKNIRWKERYNVQFRAEALNLPNHPNFNDPGTALGSAGFGVISAAKDPRIMQLGLRIEF
jgi:hypothetical protein